MGPGGATRCAQRLGVPGATEEGDTRGTIDSMTASLANSTQRPMGRLAVVASLAMVVGALDQAVKALVSRVVGPLPLAGERWVAGDWLGLDYVRNQGVAFGITLGGGAVTLAISLIAFAVAGTVFWRLGSGDRLASVGLGLLAGGAIGNFVDRVRFGYVVDFIAVGPWPRFNIADSGITIGMILLAWSALQADSEDTSEPAGNTRDEYGET